MRKLLISLLLAGAAASPALAAPNDETDRAQARQERQQAREAKQQAREQSRAERPSNFERPNNVERPQFVQPNPQTVQPQAIDRSARIQEREASRAERVDQRQQRADQRQDARKVRQSTRPLPNVMQTRVPVVSNVPREGTQPPPRYEARTSAQPNWSTSWRYNNKYDWYNWRKRHRSLFHFGFYYDPFGWGYSPYEIGWRLWPSYYGSRYWIDDPWQYRLPYAPPGTQWIRYYDDALLVDTWSGQVVDVIYNFFW